MVASITERQTLRTVEWKRDYEWRGVGGKKKMAMNDV